MTFVKDWITYNKKIGRYRSFHQFFDIKDGQEVPRGEAIEDTQASSQEELRWRAFDITGHFLDEAQESRA